MHHSGDKFVLLVLDTCYMLHSKNKLSVKVEIIEIDTFFRREEKKMHRRDVRLQRADALRQQSSPQRDY